MDSILTEELEDLWQKSHNLGVKDGYLLAMKIINSISPHKNCLPDAAVVYRTAISEALAKLDEMSPK